MEKLLLLGLAGGLGTLSRYGLSGLVQRFLGGSFPYGTFAVNVIGCFFFGLIWGMLEERIVINPHTRIIVLAGFMGAFTTFSTYMFESLSLMQHGQWAMGLLNILGQNVVGLILIFLGLSLGRAVWG